MTLLESEQARFYSRKDIYFDKPIKNTQCPHCHSHNIEDLSNIVYEYDMICNVCGHRWE